MIDESAVEGGDRLDLQLFWLCFVSGSGVLALSFSRVQGVWLHVGVAVVMVGYAVTTWRTPRLRLRLDQAGDNAYYLGLLFTLVSMAFALFQSSSGALSARSLLPAFGVAISSTILGVFLRISLQQMRVDPVDVEKEARQELADAASRLKGALDISVRSFSNFPTELNALTRDAIREVLDGWLETVRGKLEISRTVLEAEMQAVSKLTGDLKLMQSATASSISDLQERVSRLGASVEETLSRLSKVSAPPTRLATVLEKTATAVAAATGDLEDAQLLLVNVLRGCSSATESTRLSISQLAEIVDSLRSKEVAAAEASAAALQLIGSAATKLSSEVAKSGDTLAELRRAAEDSREEHLRLRQSSAATLEGLNGAVKSLTRSIDQIGR